MNLTLWLELVAFVLLMGLSAFFSSSETAMFSLSQIQLEQLRREGGAKSLDRPTAAPKGRPSRCRQLS